MQNNENFAENANAPLIRVELNEKGETVVSARALYSFLEVKTEFPRWCERMFEYGFVENQDYTKVIVKNDDNPKGGRSTLIDYALTLDCAKQISMLQRNEKGKQARQYFIDCEKQLKTIQQNLVTQDKLNLVMGLVQGNFEKLSGYLQEMQEEIDELKENQQKNIGELENTTQRVDKIEDYLDFKSVACVYVMFCPRRKLYKIGSSHHPTKGRSNLVL